MKYEDFKKLKASEKWFHVWTALDNHLGQIKEIKWWARGMGIATATVLVGSFVKFVIMK